MQTIIAEPLYEECNGYTIIYVDGIGIIDIQLSGRSLTSEFSKYIIDTNNSEFSNHLFDNMKYMVGLKSKLYELFELALNVENQNGKAYCYLSTFTFQALTAYTQYLKFFNLHFNALKFLYQILNIVSEWEREHGDAKIHKGALFGYIGEMYMHILDYESAFTFLHRSVKEDKRISNYITTYPEDAPSYKIINLKSAEDHFMAGYVNSVRDLLNKNLQSFRKVFTQYKAFDMIKFNEIFIDNKFFNNGMFEDIKAKILYCIWGRYYYAMKVGERGIPGMFDNLNRVNKLFELCVIIETLGKELKICINENPKSNKRLLNLEQQSKLFEFLGGSKSRFDELHSEVKDKDEKVGEIVEQLLKFEEEKYNGKNVNALERSFMIYVLIRNFAAHNIRSIDMIGQEFFRIFSVLLNILFILLIEAKNEKKQR